MRSVLISINPKWCELIASGIKTVEIRKNRPKIETPFKVYIYQTKLPWVYNTYSKIANWQQKVIGEFICDSVTQFDVQNDFSMEVWKISFLQNSRLKISEIMNYIGVGNKGYMWNISDLKIYNAPIELTDFNYYCIVDCKKCRYYKIQYSKTLDKNLCVCKNYITNPPRSWCYVEEGE